MAFSFFVSDALDDPIGIYVVAVRGYVVVWVVEVGFVDGEDESADTWDRFEFEGGSRWPRGAVVGADVCATFP